MRHVLTAICGHKEKSAPDTASIEAERAELKSNTLTKELVELLIGRVLASPIIGSVSRGRFQGVITMHLLSSSIFVSIINHP